MHSDPIADLLTRIRNGARAGHTHVDAPYSTIKQSIVKLLEQEGFVSTHEVVQEGKFPVLRVQMRYDIKRKPIFIRLKRISTPGLRIYRSSRELKPIRGGLGVLLISTSHGLMTDREARKRKIGGEVICEVW